MPIFLEFLFTFKKQDHKKNFDFSGFRFTDPCKDQPFSDLSAVPVPLSSRFQLCYNLRCVESTPLPPEWPWSMRQTAVYHNFDLDNGHAVWINIKGNTDIAPRLKKLIRPSAPSDPSTMRDAAGAFKATLATHLIYCEWAGENWAAYVGFLEDELQNKTRYALLADVPKPKPSDSSRNTLDRRATAPPPATRSLTMDSLARAGRNTFSKFWGPAATRQPAVTTPSDPQDTELETLEQDLAIDNEETDFKYDDLRGIQHIEDQANVTLLALRSNISILRDLTKFYSTLPESEEFKRALGGQCDVAIRRFSARVDSIINDMKLQQSRLETLLQLLADRKALVCRMSSGEIDADHFRQLLQLFAHRNMSTSKHLSIRAQISAEKMEGLTNHMMLIAEKTEKETIFMRIITVVTLFFLPGTFVAVSRLPIRHALSRLISQTLMSTDIVKFQNDNNLIHRFSWLALAVYLGITVPIMGITIWISFRYRRRAQLRLARKRAEAEKVDLELGLLIEV
jgi:hypothetical protein